MYEKRFSQRELDLLHSNKVTGNLDHAWKSLVLQIQGLMDYGTPATDEKAQEAAGRWIRLMADTTGNDPSLAIKLRSLHKEERKVQLATGITMEMVAYISQANHSRSVPRPTALKVAQLRAVHQLLDTPLVFEDPLALKILVRAERRKP